LSGCGQKKLAIFLKRYRIYPMNGYQTSVSVSGGSQTLIGLGLLLRR
jgi:hypothetical protein